MSFGEIFSRIFVFSRIRDEKVRLEEYYVLHNNRINTKIVRGKEAIFGGLYRYVNKLFVVPVASPTGPVPG
jgi:hypothetical protein